MVMDARVLVRRFAYFRKVQVATINKKELANRIADSTQTKQVMVKRIIKALLDEIINELSKGNRLEFRDFGVFETRTRAARTAQNPKTLEPVEVPAKRTVKFKPGRLLKQGLESLPYVFGEISVIK
jgi:nucleoid DNA-binding protein